MRLRPRPSARRLAGGPLPALPRPLDRLSELWFGLPPRLRVVCCVLILCLLALAIQARLRAADQRWGGAAVRVLVAAEDLPVGARPALRRVELPPAAVPPGARTHVDHAEVLSLALPRGSVLTTAHTDRRGPAAGLAPGLRAVPVPVERGWSVVAGGWVDVWVLGAGGAPARLVARSRPVLQVRPGEMDRTALIGLAEPEVAAATTGLALGRVLLAHAPPAGTDGQSEQSDPLLPSRPSPLPAPSRSP